MKLILVTILLSPFILTGMVASVIRIGFRVGWDFMEYHIYRHIDK